MENCQLCSPAAAKAAPSVSRSRRTAAILLAALCVLPACDPTEEVAIQPLPPLTRPGPEARMGLPEIEGQWRFAGWDVPVSDAPEQLGAPGELWIETQRLDSLAGVYVAGEQRLPIVGEVRRDSIFALVVRDGNGAARYLAGRARPDTIWVELTSLVVAQNWPQGTRAAFVRQPVGQPFVRLPGGVYRVEELEEPEVAEVPERVEPPATAEPRAAEPPPDTAPRAAQPPAASPPAAQPTTPAPLPRPDTTPGGRR